MRGIPSLITDIRKKVFAEVARMAYSGDYTQMEDIPYHIVPGDSPLHRNPYFSSARSRVNGYGWRWGCPSGPCRPAHC